MQQRGNAPSELMVLEVSGGKDVPVPTLPRFLAPDPCPSCGARPAACHLCPGPATHFLDVERGPFYLCSHHSALAHAWEEMGFGEYGTYAPTVDCQCDPWRMGSP